MSEKSLLATVHAAATEGGNSDKTVVPKATTKILTIESVKAEHPSIAEQLHAEGVTAERQRILGIEAQALPGHEALITELKADGKTTPEQAAVKILAVERAAVADRKSEIEHADADIGDLKSTPNADAAPASRAFPQTDEGWAAEYAASADLQAEFVSAETYVAQRRAETAGRVKVLKGKAA